MKKYLILFILSSVFLYCHSEKENPEPQTEYPEENPYDISCGCGNEWPQDELTCTRELPWDYPIKALNDEFEMTEEWKQLKTRQERIDASQIPEDVLLSLCTDDLVELCMKNPLVDEIWQYRPYDAGLDSLIERFNCFRELFKRTDASKGLLNYYKCAMQNLSFLNTDALSIKKGDFVVKIAIVEIFLSRLQIVDDTNKEEYIEILQHLVCGYEKILQYPDYLTPSFSLSKNVYSRACQIVRINEQILEQIPQRVRNHLFITQRDIDIQTVQIINELSCQYIQ